LGGGGVLAGALVWVAAGLAMGAGLRSGCGAD